jgi:hypothetical protein
MVVGALELHAARDFFSNVSARANDGCKAVSHNARNVAPIEQI